MERVLRPLCPPSGMLSASRVSSSSEDTSSSSDETDVEVTATRPQASGPPRSLASVWILSSWKGDGQGLVAVG